MTKLNQRLKSPLSNRRRGCADIIRLTDLSLLELRKEWQRYFGPAPEHRAGDLLRRVLAWRIQAEAYGGLDATTKRLLSKEGSDLRPTPQPGMRLAREWAGRRHEVVVIESGVVYEGQKYGSLSEVARHITGQRWNGPRFFGLRGANVR
ncbi:MAG: hypothetical protein RLZZ561_404 [Pseudomonadota bacterium]